MDKKVGTKEAALDVQQSLAVHWILHIGLVEYLIPRVNAILPNESLALFFRMIEGTLLDEGVTRTCENIAASQVVHERGLLDQGAELLGDAVAEDVALAVHLAEHLARLDALVDIACTWQLHLVKDKK